MKSWARRRVLWLATAGAVLVLVVSILHPVNSSLIKLALLGSATAAWAGLVTLGWKRLSIRIPLLLLPLAAAVPFLLPSAEIDSTQLRASYVQNLIDFERTPYHWGGENAHGIDCSGLPRRALRDALVECGIRTRNGKAFRAWAEQWWFDASAKALGESYRDYTEPLEPSGIIREMDHTYLVPGDLAVTTNGVHVLVYLGEYRWIQADPGHGAVLTLNGQRDGNPWFSSPVTTHRWTILGEP